MDDLSVALNNSGIGGYLGGAFLNHLCYADDICLISLSSHNVVRYYIVSGLGPSTVDQVLKYTKCPKYIPSTSTGQVLIFFKRT